MERARYNTEPYSNRSPPPNIMLNRPTFGGHIIMVMYYWLFLGMKIQYTNLFLLLLAMNIKESNQQHGENGNYAKMTTTYIYFYT